MVMILSLSSTAIVIQTMNEKGLMKSVSGQVHLRCCYSGYCRDSYACYFSAIIPADTTVHPPAKTIPGLLIYLDGFIPWLY